MGEGIIARRGGGGGIELKELPNYELGRPWSNTVTERLNVVGSGWVISICNRDISNVRYFKLEIDGVVIIPTSSNSGRAERGNSITFMYRFKNGFKFFDDANIFDVFYVLGDDLSKSAPMAYTPVTSAVILAPRHTISGKGYILGIESSDITHIRLFVDGTRVIPPENVGDRTKLWERPSMLFYRFESEVKLDASSTWVGLIYNKE